MKTTHKIINGMGGIPIHAEEGGGCTFFMGSHIINILPNQYNRNLKTLISILVKEVYLIGKEAGIKETQDSIKAALSLSINDIKEYAKTT